MTWFLHFKKLRALQLDLKERLKTWAFIYWKLWSGDSLNSCKVESPCCLHEVAQIIFWTHLYLFLILPQKQLYTNDAITGFKSSCIVSYWAILIQTSTAAVHFPFSIKVGGSMLYFLPPCKETQTAVFRTISGLLSKISRNSCTFYMLLLIV